MNDDRFIEKLKSFGFTEEEATNHCAGVKRGIADI